MDAEKVDRELVRAWVDGWIVSRQASPPVEEEWGFSFDVALPRHVTRHVLPEADEALLVELMAAFPAPGTHLKVPLPPETVRPWLLPGWILDDPGFLMTVPLTPVPAPVPDGFRLRTWGPGRSDPRARRRRPGGLRRPGAGRDPAGRRHRRRGPGRDRGRPAPQGSGRPGHADVGERGGRGGRVHRGARRHARRPGAVHRARLAHRIPADRHHPPAGRRPRGV
ncbi:LOW QUALITY PROTEIN: conserved hypothetical protein, partial [Streptomyces himastatinicus ATCC 53653]